MEVVIYVVLCPGGARRYRLSNWKHEHVVIEWNYRDRGSGTRDCKPIKFVDKGSKKPGHYRYLFTSPSSIETRSGTIYIGCPGCGGVYRVFSITIGQ